MSNLSIRFDRMYERDRQTDRQTPHDGKGNKKLSCRREAARASCLSV